MKAIIIYDDTGRKSEVISDIIGDKGFAEVVVKKRHLEECYRDELSRIFSIVLWKRVKSVSEYSDIMRELEVYNDNDIKVMHCFSNFLINDGKTAELSFKKLYYIDEPFGVHSNKKAVAAMFPNVRSYCDFCRMVLSGQRAWDLARNLKDRFEIDGLVDISIISNFIQCITGNFDSRYFNSLKENEYTLVKSSTNKKKIKAEYSFYHLLPDDMKYWFVMPFNYQETEDSASYTMERLHMTDLAIKWVHGSMGENEFEELMDKYFYFFRSRHKQSCSKDVYQKVSDSLYINKVNSRIEELRGLPEYKKIKVFLDTSEELKIENLLDKYYDLKRRIESRIKYPTELVIGHGDPCFANALYNKSTRTLKFIDPKGALNEQELWTNPYYDVAKLSHSVCGRYDFFNNALFEIKVDSAFSLNLEIPFHNKRYIDIFKRKVEENGFDYLSVRIYEASLFLSMLPLHIDNPHKVLAFILNVKNILGDIEKNV